MTSLLAFYSLLAPALAAAMAFLAGLMAAVLVVLAVGGAR